MPLRWRTSSKFLDWNLKALIVDPTSGSLIPREKMTKSLGKLHNIAFKFTASNRGGCQSVSVAFRRMNIQPLYSVVLSNGLPGLCPQYCLACYRAYILDEGRNIQEAVWLKPEILAGPWCLDSNTLGSFLLMRRMLSISMVKLNKIDPSTGFIQSSLHHS